MKIAINILESKLKEYRTNIDDLTDMGYYRDARLWIEKLAEIKESIKILKDYEKNNS